MFFKAFEFLINFLVLVSTPQVQQEGSVINVKWRSVGNGRGVFGYRVLFRTQNTGWNPFGYFILH